MEKKFYYAIIVAILIIAIISSWDFLFGFVIAGVIFWYFGEEKVKSAVKNVYDKTHDLAKDLQNKTVPKAETAEVIISQSSIFPSNINSLYQIVIIAENKSYLLKPLEITMLPVELASGKTIQIITSYKRDGLEVIKEQKIVANGNNYEVIG